MQSVKAYCNQNKNDSFESLSRHNKVSVKHNVTKQNVPNETHSKQNALTLKQSNNSNFFMTPFEAPSTQSALQNMMKPQETVFHTRRRRNLCRMIQYIIIQHFANITRDGVKIIRHNTAIVIDNVIVTGPADTLS